MKKEKKKYGFIIVRSNGVVEVRYTDTEELSEKKIKICISKNCKMLGMQDVTQHLERSGISSGDIGNISVFTDREQNFEKYSEDDINLFGTTLVTEEMTGVVVGNILIAKATKVDENRHKVTGYDVDIDFVKFYVNLKVVGEITREW